MLPEPPDWQARAACLNADSDSFYPDKGDSALPAKAICNGDDERPPCEVREACLSWALDRDERQGVWGGLSAREREQLRRRLGLPDRIPTGQPCGTHAAYQRHHRFGEEPCEPCREAHSRYTTERHRERERAS